MKKLLTLTTLSFLLMSTTFCGSPKETGSAVPAAGFLTECFSREATIEDTVLIDEAGLKITATQLDYYTQSAYLRLTIENNSDEDIFLYSGNHRYDCNSINGCPLPGIYLYCMLHAGEKTEETVRLDIEKLLEYGINEISNIELGIFMRNNKFNYTYFEPKQVKTSIYAPAL